MQNTLQKKFVFFTTIISIIVMLTIAIAINTINYLNILTYSDDILTFLVDNSTNLSIKPTHQRFPKEFEFTTRFFVVNSTEDDIVNFVDTNYISSVTSEEAKAYIAEVSENAELFGTIDNYRYIKTENSAGFSYIFLDIEEDIMSFETSVFYSILIVCFAVIFIFLLSCIFSKKAVSPIVEGYENQKRFITDASHEFKTPLAIMKANCDVIEIDNGEGEWTHSIKSQISRLDSLVDTLISLTKLDEEKTVIIKTDFSLSDAVNDTIHEFSPAFKNANLNVATDISENITLNGDETFIRKLLSILTENAIKYSVGYIDITLLTKGNKKYFSIENSCAELDVGKHNNWFERFYRADQSRNSATKGFGIGLSIAKTICDKHGARIFSESNTGKEIKISVVF